MDRLTYPHAQRQFQLTAQGVFATPQDWKSTDQANPGLFTYTLRCLTLQLEKGKIQPRELTPKELREQQEKNKKGGKKESKKQQGNAQQERLKKLEEQEERKRQETWSKLSEEDQKYRDYEDPFRSPQLKFQSNTVTETLSGKLLVIFEERVQKDQGQWVYFIKSPSVSEDQLAKLRKAKPKTLANINDLNPVVMRCWVDFSALNSKDNAIVTQRCKLVQVDKTPQTSEPNLQNTYMKISLKLQKPYIQKDDGLVGELLIPNPPETEPVSEKVMVVGELTDELRLGIESLAMQFSAMFWKQLNIYEDVKNLNYFINKKNDITKRKEHFLYDFNVSGKYKILKDRLKKVIVHLCEKYFSEQIGTAKSFTGVSCSSKDQFYSQIYTFLVTKYKEILQHLIFQKKEGLKEVEVLSPLAQRKSVEKILIEQFKESQIERITRILEQYQILGNFEYGEKLYKRYIDENPTNPEIKYNYSLYCIRNKLKKPEDTLPFLEEYLSFHKDDQKVRLQYLLLLIASETEENCKKAWVLLRQLIASNPSEISNFLLASFLFNDLLGMSQLGAKYQVLAQRTYLKQSGKLDAGSHKENPINSQIPSAKGVALYSQTLGDEDRDKLWVQVLTLFIKMNLFNVVAKLQAKIVSTNNQIFDILKLQSLLSENKFEEFQALSKQLYDKSKSSEILALLSSYFLEHPSPEAEKYLKINLIKSQGDKQIEALLKLSYFYLNKQQYANCRSCVLKYLEKRPINSGFSWRILGICKFRLGNSKEALDSLRKANASDINNCQNWLWLARLQASMKNFVMCNQCLNQYESMLGKKCRGEQAKEIIESINVSSSSIICEQKMRLDLKERLQAKQTS